MNKLQKTFNDIVERTRAKSIGTADSFSGLCPAHDDKSASLSITLENDKILLYCHAGCNIDNICVSLGIEQTDLFAHGDEKQINLGPQSVAWLESEVSDWMEQRILESRGGVSHRG